ncbi:DNA primase [Priestia megaterium]|uniref:bifunctional DNA primase/polymerase n=1 Tax=Priestia megaterium TaxID=1404 RepID=UPI000BFCD60F|nr:bifunctional DNA primase/polymerase [Priestia megaterium]PGR23026.1 DNA primase [Priestia megaterium]
MEDKKSLVQKIPLQHQVEEKISKTSIYENKIKSYKAAFAYVQVLKWPVFPLHSIQDGRCTCGRTCGSMGKHPRIKNGFKAATTDLTIIKRWWKQWPNSNIGIPTGQLSGFIAIDIDPRHGGNESLDELISRNGKLPNTVEAITGGGGKHILFKYQGQVSNKVEILPGIDIRGDGGYIVVSPSIHYSGGAYEWELSSHPIHVPLAEIPKWLLYMITAPKQEQGQYTKKSSNYWHAVMRGVGEGKRNLTSTKILGHLFRRYVDPYIILAVMEMWNKRNDPPLTEEELHKIINSISTKELKRRKGGGRAHG